MKRLVWQQFGEICRVCGFIGKRNQFRCFKCKSGDTYEHDYISCPAELGDPPCNIKMELANLPEHLAVRHPHELAQFFSEHVLRVYKRGTRKVGEREYTPQRQHKRGRYDYHHPPHPGRGSRVKD